MNFPANKPEKRHLVHHLDMALSTMRCMNGFDKIMTNSAIPRRSSKTCVPRSRPNLVTVRASSDLYQKSHDELGRKYEDALLKIDKINVNPNFSSTILDKVHNEIFDRDEKVDRLLTEVGTQQETIERIGRDTRRAVGRLNDRLLVIKGATDFSIPESHLTDMHALAGEQHTEVEEMSSTIIAALKIENQAASSEMQEMKLAICGVPCNATPRNECEEKCAKLRSEMNELKKEKNEEVRRLKDELRKMEERKDQYKNFSQAEDRANDEEQEYCAEAEAFEKLRNELQPQCQRVADFGERQIQVVCVVKNQRRSISNHGQRPLSYQHGKGSVIHEVCVASGDRDMMIGKLGYHLVSKINQTWTC